MLIFVVSCYCMQIQRTGGQWYWAEYSTFSISDEVGKYQLTVAGYSGDSSDAIVTPPNPDWVSNGRMFTTMDDENDTWPGGNCAQYGAGGWWFGECSSSEVNRDGNGIWQTHVATFDVQASRMLVKIN